MLLNDDIDCFIDHFSQTNPELVKKATEWLERNKNFHSLNVTQKDLNAKFKEFSKVFIFFISLPIHIAKLTLLTTITS